MQNGNFCMHNAGHGIVPYMHPYTTAFKCLETLIGLCTFGSCKEERRMLEANRDKTEGRRP